MRWRGSCGTTSSQNTSWSVSIECHTHFLPQPLPFLTVSCVCVCACVCVCRPVQRTTPCGASTKMMAPPSSKSMPTIVPSQVSTTTHVHVMMCCHGYHFTDMSLSCHMPGLLVTAGSDDTIKFWDIHVCTNQSSFFIINVVVVVVVVVVFRMTNQSS